MVSGSAQYLRLVRYLAIAQAALGIFTVLGSCIGIMGLLAVRSVNRYAMDRYSLLNRYYCVLCMIVSLMGTLSLYSFASANNETATCTVNGVKVPFEKCQHYLVGILAYVGIAFGISGLLHLSSDFYIQKALEKIPEPIFI
jgi:hypothetical protein